MACGRRWTRSHCNGECFASIPRSSSHHPQAQQAPMELLDRPSGTPCSVVTAPATHGQASMAGSVRVYRCSSRSTHQHHSPASASSFRAAFPHFGGKLKPASFSTVSHHLPRLHCNFFIVRVPRRCNDSSPLSLHMDRAAAVAPILPIADTNQTHWITGRTLDSARHPFPCTMSGRRSSGTVSKRK